jgi:hypothetical protein
VVGSLRLVDAANRLEAVLHFGPVEGTRHRVLERADAVVGEIYQLPAESGGFAGGAGGGLTSADPEAEQEDQQQQQQQQQQQVAADASMYVSSTPGASSGGKEALLSAPDTLVPQRDQDDLGDTTHQAAKEKEDGAISCGSMGVYASSAAADTGLTGSMPASCSSSTSSSNTGSASRRGSRSSGRSKPAPVVPGVAVAYIEGSWLSHLNIDNKR